ncbi:conserved hypothetical protein [[Clostridium] saccharolyticum WM1]|uniref:Uncharacterized protein n=2 Tax=Lacrimispora TaxID=2719231 RepID=D9QZG4_LACSW|nr:conserved hypothetical protein [[Clostridium] saccharolyticum WM1]
MEEKEESKLNQMIIKNYNDFVSALLEAGFSMGGGNSEGVFSIITWNWEEQPPYDTPVCWHTGDPETDPWEWRMRVLDERDDIAYGKFFFKKSGYITKQWIPYFLAARRDNTLFEEAYEEGLISNYAKRIYNVVAGHEVLPLHEIKQLAGFGKEEKSQFDRALTELQMKLYLTMCGRQQKISSKGEEYGWSSTVFCTTERYWGEEIFRESEKIEKAEAIEKIAKQIDALNQEADQKKMMRFIKG